MADQLYQSYEKTYDYYDQVGIYAYNGPDQEADAEKLCFIFGKNHPECRMAKKPSGFGQTFSVKSQQHIFQNKIEGRFQEYSDTYAMYDKYLKDKVVRKTEQYDLTDVQDTVPVTIYLGGKDDQCPQQGDSLLEQFKHPQPKQKVFPEWKHLDFVQGEHLNDMVSDIFEVLIN